MYRLIFYVPLGDAQKVKNAVFEAGAGQYRGYSRCCWETLGTGQFLATEGSRPVIGRMGKEERVAELKVEMICHDDYIKQAVGALLEAHPYEVPPYSLIELSSVD